MTQPCQTCLPSRRNVLTGGLAATGLMVTDMLGGGDDRIVSRLSFTAPAAAAVARDVLVVLSFRGGFDGLSAVGPLADPLLGELRPTIAVPSGAMIPLDDRFGMHPAMAPLTQLYQAGKLGFVHDVGQADPTRSHFAAMAEMERAAPATSIRTGWLDRAVGAHGAGTPLRAVQVGQLETAAALSGPNPEFGLGRIDGFTLSGAWNDTERQRWATALGAMHGASGVHPGLKASAQQALSAIDTIVAIDSGPGTTRAGAAYPMDGDEPTHLARAFRDVARLVKANVGLQVACIDHGDWDMHDDLGGVDDGWMRDKLTEVAATLAAFAYDLGTKIDSTTVVTLSEFGRRVAENASGGVDHGHGNLVMLMGGGVVGGQVHGQWLGLSDDVLADGDLPGTTDYRVVLAEILEKRCLTPGVRTSVFPGLGAGRLGVARAR